MSAPQEICQLDCHDQEQKFSSRTPPAFGTNDQNHSTKRDSSSSLPTMLLCSVPKKISTATQSTSAGGENNNDVLTNTNIGHSISGFQCLKKRRDQHPTYDEQ